ncbi:DUF2786 domain-containing protein [Diaphorobacter sp. J5-51]|uniref:DUF2786 domain-containing protein n=1 Tax=Diaphorobacter sp. J5-51 TaxID=680496 RepID=UPI00069AC1D3|nr:DUF2786 domain-containing protein [Diaphorobacter sp. J5-51]
MALDPKILGKIKKCLALASSDNPNEAATALRQAHALMAAHGVSAEQISMADIGEATAKSRTMARSKAAQWEGALASVVGRAFGCQLMLKRAPIRRKLKAPLNDGTYIFVGIQAQAQIAAYTFDVLARKCKKARADWIADKLQGISQMPGGKRTVTGLGDEFAMGWVSKIARVVQDFAQPDPVELAIASFIKSRVTKEGSEDELARKPTTDDERTRGFARWHGMQAAEGESIHRPMNGAEATLQIGC